MKPPLLLLTLVLAATGVEKAAAAHPERPNILYFYVDDMGWGSIGPNGQAARKAKGQHIPAGELVYGENAHRRQPGIGFAAVKAKLTIGDRELTASVNEQTKAAVFQTELAAGSHRLSAKFFDAQGRSLDVFYVYVNKID